MLLIIILFVAFYILAYTLLKNWDSFKWGGTFDGNQMGFAIFATVVVAVIVNVTSYYINVDDIKYYPSSTEKCKVTTYDKENNKIVIDSEDKWDSNDKILRYYDNNEVDSCYAIKYISKADTTLSMAWLFNMFPSKTDSVIVYNIDKYKEK